MVRSVYQSCLRHQCRMVLDVRTLPTTTRTDDSAWGKFAECLLFASRHFSAVTYITEEMRRYCAEHYRLPDHQSAIWTSGVNPENL